MGLVMIEGHTWKYAKDYTYIEIPLLGFMDKDGELKDSVQRNQYVRVVPACSLDIKGMDKVLVEPNPAVSEFGLAQASYYMHPDQKGIPGFYFQARKDLDIKDLTHAVKLYLRA
jgi:hypothetical protein